MTTDLNTLREAVEPCPWCGEPMAHVVVIEGSTFRWRKVQGCCADGPEVRHDTLDKDQTAAEANSRARAIAAWNRRAPRLEAAADHIVDANKMVPELSREDVVRLAREAGGEYRGQWDLHQFTSNELQRFASLVRSVPPTGENHAVHKNQLGGMAETPSPVRADQSPTAGMNIAQRILHVGGRNNAAGYVEFGSIQAVEALGRQVLRDLPESPELERLRANIKVYRDSWALMLASLPFQGER